MNGWYPKDKEELNKVLDGFLSQPVSEIHSKKIHGLIVPHAGYAFSGRIAGKAFSLLKEKSGKIDKAVVLGPSHYEWFYGIKALRKIKTPFGEVKIIENNFPLYVEQGYEHSVENQIPFLQKLNTEIGILPLVVGEISENNAKEIAIKIIEIINEDAIFILSTDLSHFLPYDEAVRKDKNTIKIIENLDFEKLEEIDACGKFPLLIMMHLCRIKKWKPNLIEYKNSGDITGDKGGVVGYASFWF